MNGGVEIYRLSRGLPVAMFGAALTLLSAPFVLCGASSLVTGLIVMWPVALPCAWFGFRQWRQRILVSCDAVESSESLPRKHALADATSIAIRKSGSRRMAVITFSTGHSIGLSGNLVGFDELLARLSEHTSLSIIKTA